MLLLRLPHHRMFRSSELPECLFENCLSPVLDVSG